MTKAGIFTIAAFSPLFAACAHQESHPSPYFTQEVMVIPPSDFWSYWRSSNPSQGLPMEMGSGCISIELTIDSNGKIYDPKLVALSGPKDFYTNVLNYYAGQDFHPGPANPGRIPVHTTITISYAEGRAVPDPKTMAPCISQSGAAAKPD